MPRNAYLAAFHRMILKGTNRSFDALVSDVPKEEYSFTLLEATYRERTGIQFAAKDYISFGLTDKNRYRIDKPDYAERAVTEAIVNALIHKLHCIRQ